jgi:hypothetical protein
MGSVSSVVNIPCKESGDKKRGQRELPPFEETEKVRSYLFLKLDEKTFIWFQKTFQIIVWLV